MDRWAACLAWAYCGRGCFRYKYLRSLIAELHSWGCVRANADSGLESERRGPRVYAGIAYVRQEASHRGILWGFPAAGVLVTSCDAALTRSLPAERSAE